MNGRVYRGWLIVAAAFVTLGLTVGLPYYNLPFFYDYFAQTFHWPPSQITLGFPLAALPTVILGPILIHRFSPRKLIVIGAAISCVAFLCFSRMGPNVHLYWLIWILFAAGYILSGPIPHQVIIAHWFREHRGKAMGLIYVGLGMGGFAGSYLVKPLTESLGFRSTLAILGLLIAFACPLAILFLRDRPESSSAARHTADVNYAWLLRRSGFWLLLFGSTCSIAAIGAVNMLMKLVFASQMSLPGTDPRYQPALNSTWRAASMIILATSIVSRVVIGACSDRFSKKWVMAGSYLVSASTIPVLLSVTPPNVPWLFSSLFGLAMGADYMLIPLMAAEQFGVANLSKVMAVILPVNTIGQTWFPYFTAVLKQHTGSYTTPLYAVFGIALLSSIATALLPRPYITSAQSKWSGPCHESDPLSAQHSGTPHRDPA